MSGLLDFTHHGWELVGGGIITLFLSGLMTALSIDDPPPHYLADKIIELPLKIGCGMVIILSVLAIVVGLVFVLISF